MCSVRSAGITLGPFCWCFLHPLKILIGFLIRGGGFNIRLLLWVWLVWPACGWPMPVALPWLRGRA